MGERKRRFRMMPEVASRTTFPSETEETSVWTYIHIFCSFDSDLSERRYCLRMYSYYPGGFRKYDRKTKKNSYCTVGRRSNR